MTIGSLSCEFYVFVTYVGHLYDKFWYDKTGMSLQPQILASFRRKRNYEQ